MSNTCNKSFFSLVKFLVKGSTKLYLIYLILNIAVPVTYFWLFNEVLQKGQFLGKLVSVYHIPNCWLYYLSQTQHMKSHWR